MMGSSLDLPLDILRVDIVIYRLILFERGEQEGELFGYLCTADGDKRGFSMQLGSGDDKVAIEGSGELKGDLLSGTYTISSGEADAAVIDVTDYDTKAVQDGIWKGTYTISGAPLEDEDGNSYDHIYACREHEQG